MTFKILKPIKVSHRIYFCMLESGILRLGIQGPVRDFLLFIGTSAIQAFYFRATDPVRQADP